jgi:glucose/arabinose dehydrogenase
MFFPMENGQPKGYEVFAQGWLQKIKVWSRPGDVLIMPDGALLVSDDAGGRIFRIGYSP